MDRRYRETAGASRAASARSEALARAKLARARIDARSARGRGNEDGPKSADPFGGATAFRLRAAQEASRGQVFREEGSGVLGARPSLDEARRRDTPDGYRGLLPGLG
jgi:hypothetical protein